MRQDFPQEARQMTPTDLASLGVDEMAYVKPITVDDTEAWAIHGADGTALTVVRDRETAYAVVRQNEMEPVSLH